MRLGIFGGTFDPIHLAHLLLAESCREACHLDKVLFVPAACSPHKTDQQPSSDGARVEMLKLAIGGHPDFDVSTIEIDRGGVSYTVDTLDRIRHQQPAGELFLLMGADSLADLPTWREPSRICQLATPCIVSRPSSPVVNLEGLARLVTAEKLAEIEQSLVKMPQLDISSSDLRQRVASGRSIRYRTPRAVEKFIEMQGLYRGGE